jgi:predicted esterase
MEKILTILRNSIGRKKNYFCLTTLALALAMFNKSAISQTCGFTSFQFQRITANIHPLVKGFLWKKPSDYDSNPSKFYPTIIYFHGIGSVGNGTATQLCNIVQHPAGGSPDDALPISIQNGLAIMTVNTPSGPVEFMVFCPQYTQYTYIPGQADVQYPSAATAAASIQYFLDNYRVDPNRVYLSGMSTGANIAMEYAAASTANSAKIAALTPVALCAINIVGAGNIASTNLPVSINHCANDSRCHPMYAQGWTNAINNSVPAPNPLAKLTLMVNDGVSCNFVDAHNAWSSAYRSSYVVDGKNMYQWMIQYERNITVPVKLESYTARLNSGKVFLNWTTSHEIDAASFTIEKAGSDQRYTELVTVKANGNSNLKNSYSYIDDRPVTGLNYYRLVQTDADNNKQYFETRKVFDAGNTKTAVIILPNPIRDEVTSFINLNKAQRVVITITDMSGKQVKTKAAFYGEGNTGITIRTEDLPKGIYFLKTAGEDFSDVQKIIKQ